MSESKLFIPLLLGTNRKHRQSEKAARWLFEKMREHDEIETIFFDAQDFHLPADDYGQEIKESFPEWRDAVTNADGLVIVTPEYNHGYPGILKSILDLLLKEYIHKPVAFAAVSAQMWGGTRVIENLLPVVRELGLSPTFTDLNFPKIATKFDENGQIMEEIYHKLCDEFLNELVWMAKTFRYGRQNFPSKYHQNATT
jgi:NAD(P)H-dependent FMN reductase